MEAGSGRARDGQRASRFSYCNKASAFLQVTGLVDLTGIEPAGIAIAGLGDKSRVEILAEGPEIVLRPARPRKVIGSMPEARQDHTDAATIS